MCDLRCLAFHCDDGERDADRRRVGSAGRGEATKLRALIRRSLSLSSSLHSALSLPWLDPCSAKLTQLFSSDHRLDRSVSPSSMHSLRLLAPRADLPSPLQRGTSAPDPVPATFSHSWACRRSCWHGPPFSFLASRVLADTPPNQALVCYRFRPHAHTHTHMPLPNMMRLPHIL